MALEKHGFEPHGSTYMQIFSIVNTTPLQDPLLVKSKVAEPWIWMADYKVIYGFPTTPRIGALNPELFKGQLYLEMEEYLVC